MRLGTCGEGAVAGVEGVLKADVVVDELGEVREEIELEAAPRASFPVPAIAAES